MYCSVYYYDEIYFVGGAKFFSYPPRNLFHTPSAEFLGQIRLVLAQFAEVFAPDAGIFSDHANLPFKAVFNRDEDKSLALQCGDDVLDLALADVEEFGEVAVGRITTVFVIQRMDFDEQNFFHQRKLPGQPDVLRNPHAFEITG